MQYADQTERSEYNKEWAKMLNMNNNNSTNNTNSEQKVGNEMILSSKFWMEHRNWWIDRRLQWLDFMFYSRFIHCHSIRWEIFATTHQHLHTHEIDGLLNCFRRYFCSHSFSFWNLITINLLTKNAHFHQIITPNGKLFRFGSLSFNFHVKSNLTFNKLAFNVLKWFDRKFAFSPKVFRIGIWWIHRPSATIVL